MMAEQENTNSVGLPPKFTPLMFQDSRNPHQQLFNSPSVNRQLSAGIPLRSPSRVLFPSPNALSRSMNTSLNSAGFSSQPFVNQSTPITSTSLTGISRNQHSASNNDDQQISTSTTNKSNLMGPPLLQQVPPNVQRNMKIKTDKKGQAIESQLQDVLNQVQVLQNSNEKLLELFQDLKSEIQNDRRKNQESKDGSVDAMALSNEFKKARSTWISQLHSSQQQNDLLTETMQADFNRKIGEKEAHVNSLCCRVEHLSTELANMTAERDSTKRKLNEIIHELGRVTEDKDRIFKERNQFEKEKDHLTRSFKNKLDKKENKYSEKFAEEQLRRQAILQELNDCHDKISALQEDRQKAISEIEELSRGDQQEIASLNENITNLKSINEGISSQLIAAEEKLASQQKTITSLENMKVALGNVAKERTLLLERCTMLEAQLVTTKENMALSLNERVNKVTRKLSEERLRSEGILNELKESRDKIDALQVNHQKTISELKEISRVEHEEMALLKENIANLNATKDDLSSRLIAADNQLASHQITITNLEEIKVAFDNVSKERALLQERYSVLEAQLVETEENLACSVTRNVELERSLKDLDHQFKEKMELNSKTRQEADGMSQQLVASNAVIEENTRTITDLERQLATARESIRETQEILNKNSLTFKELETQLHECNKEQIEYEKQIAELKRDLMGNSIQLTYKEKRITELEDTLKNLQAVKQEPAVRDPKIATELENTKQRLQRKISQLQSSQSQLKEYQEKRIIAEKNVASLQSQNAALNKNLDDALRQLDERDPNIATELDNTKQRLKRKISELQYSQNQLKEDREKRIIAEKNVASLQFQNATLKKSLDDALRQGAVNSQPRPVEVRSSSSQSISSAERIEVPKTPKPNTSTNSYQQSAEVLTDPGKSYNRSVEQEEIPKTPTVQHKSILKRPPFALNSNHDETLALIRKADERADAVKRSKEKPTIDKAPSSSFSTPSCPQEKRRRFDTGTPQTRFPLSQNHRSSNEIVQKVSSSSPQVIRPAVTYTRKNNQVAPKDRQT